MLYNTTSRSDSGQSRFKLRTPTTTATRGRYAEAANAHAVPASQDGPRIVHFLLPFLPAEQPCLRGGLAPCVCSAAGGMAGVSVMHAPRHPLTDGITRLGHACSCNCSQCPQCHTRFGVSAAEPGVEARRHPCAPLGPRMSAMRLPSRRVGFASAHDELLARPVFPRGPLADHLRQRGDMA